MKGILGRKVGMTTVFSTDGNQIPVTVVEVESNVVTQIKTTDKDGYDAIQLGAFNKREKVTNKPEKGHAKKANTEPKRFLKEIRGVNVSDYTVGQVLDVNTFEAGEIVDVTGTSKGKGFQGSIKRHNQHRGPMGHGSHYHRGPGSLGTMRPMRVQKGKKLPGHMGNETVTIQNLEVISVDVENNVILISGNIPGPKGGMVIIRTAVKGGEKRPATELVSYVEESAPEVVDEPTTETAEEVTETTEVVEETEEATEEVVEEETSEEEKVEEPVEATETAEEAKEEE
jgi:large subunit ribosomal protein L3